MSPPPRPQVTILSRVRRPGISARRLRAVVTHVLRRERSPRGAAVTVVLVSDAAIRALNRRFLRADRPTDVLAFPSDAGTGSRATGAHRTGGGTALGDVVVSVPRARVQARAAGHGVATEVALLAAHGVLHLLGYNDATATQRARMMRRQRALLAELGMEVRG